MALVTVAAVQAAYVLMDLEATLAKVEELLADPQLRAADLVVFPEAFLPGTPIWIDGPADLGRRREVVRDARRPGGGGSTMDDREAAEWRAPRRAETPADPPPPPA
jgi:hypothetical protein